MTASIKMQQQEDYERLSTENPFKKLFISAVARTIEILNTCVTARCLFKVDVTVNSKDRWCRGSPAAFLLWAW